MKLAHGITINGKPHAAGAEISPWKIYPFFLLHMLAFGLSGFFMAYGMENDDPALRYFHGGFALLIYTIFYFVIFGVDQVKWMFINAFLGILGILGQMDWILSLFGETMADFSWTRHIIPSLYYVMYTFLLRQFVLDIFGGRDDPRRRRMIESAYVAISVLIYAAVFFLF